MFRDRLQQWGRNDKNRRSRNQPAILPANGRDTVCAQRRSRRQITCQSSLQTEPHVSNIPNPLGTPKGLRSVQQALQSMQNWQDHFHNSQSDQMEILQHTDSFYFLLRDISVALRFNRLDLSMCGKATRKLREASMAFQSCIGPMCTPIAVLSSIQLVLRIVSHRQSDKWYALTSEFLLESIAETLPGLHPTLLLLQALLDETATPEGLYMLYEVGSVLIRTCYSESIAAIFRRDFVSAALDIYPDTALTYAGMLCNTTRDTSAVQRAFGFTDMQVAGNRLYEILQFQWACGRRLRHKDHTIVQSGPSHLSTVQERKIDYYAWRILCNSQRMRCGFAGEEASQLNAHALMVAMKNPDGKQDLSTESSLTLRKLHLLYEKHDLYEQCQALRLEYPKAFES